MKVLVWEICFISHLLPYIPFPTINRIFLLILIFETPDLGDGMSIAMTGLVFSSPFGETKLSWRYPRILRMCYQNVILQFRFHDNYSISACGGCKELNARSIWSASHIALQNMTYDILVAILHNLPVYAEGPLGVSRLRRACKHLPSFEAKMKRPWKVT